VAGNNIGAAGEAGALLMCELCEERFASVAPIVDDTLTMQMQYAQDHPERTQVSELATLPTNS
jgi:hypothetical protein